MYQAPNGYDVPSLTDLIYPPTDHPSFVWYDRPLPNLELPSVAEFFATAHRITAEYPLAYRTTQVYQTIRQTLSRMASATGDRIPHPPLLLVVRHNRAEPLTPTMTHSAIVQALAIVNFTGTAVILPTLHTFDFRGGKVVFQGIAIDHAFNLTVDHAYGNSKGDRHYTKLQASFGANGPVSLRGQYIGVGDDTRVSFATKRTGHSLAGYDSIGIPKRIADVTTKRGGRIYELWQEVGRRYETISVVNGDTTTLTKIDVTSIEVDGWTSTITRELLPRNAGVKTTAVNGIFVKTRTYLRNGTIIEKATENGWKTAAVITTKYAGGPEGCFAGKVVRFTREVHYADGMKELISEVTERTLKSGISVRTSYDVDNARKTREEFSPNGDLLSQTTDGEYTVRRRSRKNGYTVVEHRNFNVTYNRDWQPVDIHLDPKTEQSRNLNLHLDENGVLVSVDPCTEMFCVPYTSAVADLLCYALEGAIV